MKKRLLFAALALVCTANTFAFEVGEYVFTKTQRLKVTGDNILTNYDFSNGTEGWTDATNSGKLDPDTWLVESENAPGPNGENAIVSQAANEGDATALCRVFYFDAENEGAFAPGDYLISYQIKGNTDLNTTCGETIGANYAGIFVNTDGSFAQVASTEEAPVVGVATVTTMTDDWITVNYFVSIPDKEYLVMRFERMATDVMLTNFAIQSVEEVFDTRILEKTIMMAETLIADENFNKEDAEAEKESLQKTINQAKKMIENNQLDNLSTGENLSSKLLNDLTKFMDVTSMDLQSLMPGLDIPSLSTWGRGGNYSANYKLKLDGGNWGHLNGDDIDALRSAIQNGYDHTATYNVFHEDLPAGKYYFACEIRNATTGKASWPCELTYNAETVCTMGIGDVTKELDPISGEDYQWFYMIAEVTEDGKFNASVAWPGVGKGGAFMIRNTVVRTFEKDVLVKVEHVQAWKKYANQWNAAESSRDAALALYRDGNYPWERQTLEEAFRTWDPYFKAQQAKGWMTSDGKDAGIATTEELNDWALYQGVELYSEPTDEFPEGQRLEYQVVRGYQNANNAVKAANKPFTDLATAIDNAKNTRNKGTYATGDRDAYKTAIETALATLKQVRENTSDATREADTATLQTALETLNGATDTFLASVTGSETIVDIDFSNNFELTQIEGLEGDYYVIKGNSGQIVFGSGDVDMDNAKDDADDGNGSPTYFALGYQTEYKDVLRIGSSTANVYIDAPTENDALIFSFDLWVGNLSGCNTFIDLKNANGQRVAGFSINRYNSTLAYNDFNNEENTGLDLLKYVTGVGASSAQNLAILTDANKSSFTLTVDYKAGTVQGTVVNGKNGTCEGIAVPINPALSDEDNKITTFSVGSNYKRFVARRSWFDNLKISKATAYADFEEDITESAWASETAFDPWTEGIVDVKSDKGSQVIYTLSGVRVNKAQKGFYIVNGKKVIVK